MSRRALKHCPESMAQEILTNADRILVCCHTPALLDRTEQTELGGDGSWSKWSGRRKYWWTSASVVLSISAFESALGGVHSRKTILNSNCDGWRLFGRQRHMTLGDSSLGTTGGWTLLRDDDVIDGLVTSVSAASSCSLVRTIPPFGHGYRRIGDKQHILSLLSKILPPFQNIRYFRFVKQMYLDMF
jgi:hypothetical protein